MQDETRCTMRYRQPGIYSGGRSLEAVHLDSVKTVKVSMIYINTEHIRDVNTLHSRTDWAASDAGDPCQAGGVRVWSIGQ